MMGEAGWTKTTCPYCGVGCGVLARMNGDGTADVKGDPAHPANFGRLCSKGSALGETMSLEDRLLTPMIGGEPAAWDDALEMVAETFRDTIAKHGPNSVALYVSGQILTEDYYVANKLAKGYLGTANIDTNSRLCMASSVAGHKRAFGSDTVPGTYEDLELADLVVLVGSNLAWCHPVLYQRLERARQERGTQVVVIDPRMTATCEIADLHLAIAPGSDVALFNGLLAHLSAIDKIDRDYIERHTSGFGKAIKSASALSLQQVADICGLAEDDIGTFYGMFSVTEKTVTVYSQGVNQSSSGTNKVNAILNCHLATGRIGRPGAGPFSVTGQPNAMGGREVGGLANMLAAHMDLADGGHRRIVQEFWGAPHIADAQGYKAVDLFDAVSDGRVKAVWIMATNPVDSLPEADRVRDALKACPFVVVSDVARDTDTTALADVLLPATAWGEKDGTVTNSERCISRQRAFVERPGETRPDWWQICEVAKRLGFGDAFDYAGPHQIFAEHAALSGVENDGARDFDISAFQEMAEHAYNAFEPTQWPQPQTRNHNETRFFAHGGFFTDDGRGRFIETPYAPPGSAVCDVFPFVLNTGRIRDQWHTMTRTAKTPRLMAHMAEPFIEVHLDDAEALGLKDGVVAEVESAYGHAFLRVLVSPMQRLGSVFAPIHWTDQLASRARIDSLVASHTDPYSGQPESKYTPVALRHFAASWHGFAVSTEPFSIPGVTYHALAKTNSGFRLELADGVACDDWDGFATALFSSPGRQDDEILTYRDVRAGHYRFARLREGRLVAALFVSGEPLSVARTWAAGQLGEEIGQSERLRILAGRPGADVPDKGAIVCACFEVGANDIAACLAANGCATVDEVGARTKAGTNCGSCRSEIARIINVSTIAKAG